MTTTRLVELTTRMRSSRDATNALGHGSTSQPPDRADADTKLSRHGSHALSYPPRWRPELTQAVQDPRSLIRIERAGARASDSAQPCRRFENRPASTKPALTGSPPLVNTIGMIVVDALAAKMALPPPVAAITTTLRSTSSVASAGKRSCWFSA